MFISHLQSFFGSSVDYGGMLVTKNGNMTNEPLFGVIKGTLPGRPLRTPIRNVTRCSMQSSPRHSPHIAAPIFRFFTPEPRNDDLLLERLAELRRAQPGVRAELRGTLSQWGKDRFGVCRVGDQSSGEQTDGEKAADGLEPAWGASAIADTNPSARRRMGEHLPALVSGFPP